MSAALEVFGAVLALGLAAGAAHQLRGWWVSRDAAGKERKALAASERARAAADKALTKAGADVDRIDRAAAAQADKESQQNLGDWLNERGAGK